jgi:hypothetical protein
MKIFNTVFVFLVIFCSACDVINPDEPIPAFVRIETFDYDPQGGSTSEKITDAWVTVNGDFLGAFDVPKVFPVLAEGNTEFIIDAGIKVNGISNTPNIYPMYERYSTSANLVPGDTLTIRPVTEYKSDVKILFEDDFNDGVSRFSDLEVTTVDVSEGSASGYIMLDKDAMPGIATASDIQEEFPAQIQGYLAYLEMDYKSDIPLFVGLTGYDVQGNVVFTELTYGLNTREDWNKVYFDFTQVFSLMIQSNASRYEIRVSAQIPLINGEFALENAEIRLDNIKLLAF